MRSKREVVRVKPAVSDIEQQMVERRINRRITPGSSAPKLAKPRRVDRDKETYFRAEFYCPVCGNHLTSYTYSRAWTENGLHDDKRVDCHNCGQMMDWNGVPGED